MRKLAAGILVAIVLVGGMAHAQTPSKADSVALAQKQAHEQQTIAAVNALVGYMAKYASPSDTAAKAADSSAGKHATWGGILDKSLGMLSGAISKIAETLEQAAPYVWDIMVRQQYAKAFSGLAIPLIALIFIFFFHRFVNKRWTADADEKFDTMVNNGRPPTTQYDKGYGWGWRIFIGRALPLGSGIVASGYLISAIQDALLYTMNPYYYAIRDLVVLLLGTSHGM